MASSYRGYRISILICIVALVALLIAMSFRLLSEQQSLSIAERDNTQWGISELNTEFANLHLALSNQNETSTQGQLRLRFDLALSRLNLINSGRLSDLLSEDETAEKLSGKLNDFAASAAKIIDQNEKLSKSQIDTLLNLTSEIRPTVRELTLLGVKLDAELSDQRRADFINQLKYAGMATLGFVALLVLLLLVLDRMLSRLRKHDEQIIVSSNRQSSIIEASLDAIITADEQGHITEYNQAAETVFGWSRDEMLGATMEETIIPHAFREAHNNGMKRFLKTRQPNVVGKGRIELTALRKTGEEFPVEINITSVDHHDGTHFIAYLRDISERKISEQKLIDARDRAERTDKAKSQFLAVMSHEMRTPLNGILGVLDLLGTTKLSKTQSHYVKVANASSEILLEHVNEALDITRIETGMLVTHSQSFEIDDQISELLEVLKPLAVEKGLQLTLSIEDKMNVPYYGDSNRIRQILTNLIGNAIKFTDSGAISIEVGGIHGPAETSLEIAVRDTGPGIEPENIEKIFADFTSLAHSYGRQSRGDGLGLSIARKIARQLGGDISVDSVLGSGSTFWLKLPVQRSNKRDSSNVANDGHSPARSSASSKTILVVEDNAINRDVLKDMLNIMGHKVYEATNGLEAIEYADRIKFDIIIMDISMPVMGGVEATEKIRKTEGLNTATTIVGLTAHGHEEYKQSVEEAGMNALFTKPIRLPTLKKLIDGDANTVVFNPSGQLLDQASLKELISTLGGDKVRKTSARFFEELDDFLGKLTDRESITDYDAHSADVHKLRGAAAMLGFIDLEKKIAVIEPDKISELQHLNILRVIEETCSQTESMIAKFEKQSTSG